MTCSKYGSWKVAIEVGKLFPKKFPINFSNFVQFFPISNCEVFNFSIFQLRFPTSPKPVPDCEREMFLNAYT